MSIIERVTVNLREDEKSALEPFIAEGHEEHEALIRWAQANKVAVGSQGALIRALALLGAEHLREGARNEALEAGYARLAADQDASKAERRAIRDRAMVRAEARIAE